MRALVPYLLKDFLRSNRYFMPVAAFMVAVPWLYSIKPNPVLESYGVTCGFLFAVSVWFSLQFLLAEPVRQQELTLLHAGGTFRFALGKLAAVGVCSLVFSVYAVLVPVAMGAFDRRATAWDLLLGAYAHEAAFALGALIVWLGYLLFRRMNLLLGSLLLGVVLSLAAGGLERVLLDWGGWASWLLPPVYRIMKALTDYDMLEPVQLSFHLIYPLVYALIGFSVAVKLFRVHRT